MSNPVSAASEPQIAKTIFISEINESLTFSLVEYVDGRLDIWRNGARISPHPWPASEVANCVITFRKISQVAAEAMAGRRDSTAGR